MTTPSRTRLVRTGRTVVGAAALLVASLSLTACEAADVETEAEALVGRLEALDGVVSVAVAYEDLGGWEADEITYTVDVEPGTGGAAVGDVAAAVYATVRDGDVDEAAVSATLRLDDDDLTLRIFKSSADADEVDRAASAVARELRRGRTTLEVDTSMREADEPLDLSVNQILAVQPTAAEARRAEDAWQAVIDGVGRGGAFVGGPDTYR